MSTPETLTIKSDYGDDVEYTIHPHGAAEGFDLAPKILGLLSAPARAMIALASTGKAEALPAPAPEEGELVPDDFAGEVEGALSGMNGRELSQAITEFGQAIVTAGGHKLCLQILKYTAVHVDGASYKIDLAGFNRRYVGNYGELFFALYHAVRVNFGPMITRLMKGGDPLGALGALAKKTRK